MIRYLLDTNILVDLIRGKENTAERIRTLGLQHCAISDLTLFELYCGAQASLRKEENLALIDRLATEITVLPSAAGYREAARQKVRLNRAGERIEDIDLMIGCTAIAHNCTLLTDNKKHLSRLEGLTLL